MIGEKLMGHEEREPPSELSEEEAVERVEKWLECAHGTLTVDNREKALREVMTLHERLLEQRPEVAQKAELAFLLLLRDEPPILEEAEYRRFIIDHIDPDDFYRLHWESAEEVVAVAEVLYAMRFGQELPPDTVTGYVRDMIRHALRQFERNNEPEKMFRLLERAPIPPAMMDAELVRLRNRLHLYEVRRVQRKRRFLYIYLLLQVAIVLVIFPLLFRNFENGHIQREVERATGLEIVDGRVECNQTMDGVECKPPFQIVSFEDSVYWSVITYGAIGYGDLAPVTTEGKILAGLHGLMGVLTTGVIAGLILNWITPRELN